MRMSDGVGRKQRNRWKWPEVRNTESTLEMDQDKRPRGVTEESTNGWREVINLTDAFLRSLRSLER